MSDRLPVCEMCRNFPGEYNFCPITARCCRDDYLYESCSDFEQKALPTLFHRITASPEVLAEEMVFLKDVVCSFNAKDNTNFVEQWISTVCNDVYPSKHEAIAATVERLKEVEK